jgi:tetratricopeptide (TPR) repeat protein
MHEQTPGATAETKRTPQAAISTERSTKSPAYYRSIAEIGVQVAEALDHAHQHGVIHRDVKPANVILDNAGKPWVTDFGLARIETDAALTVTGDLLGTVRYMSPEQALAKRIVVDHRTDVYSLGATLYELLTLRPVFSGQDRQELLRQIALEEPKTPRRLNKAIPEELEIIVLKAMAKNPAERYDTAQELADDLRRFLEDRPIRARRPTLAQRAAKWSRRHRPIVWSAGVSVFVLLVLGLIGLGMGNLMITKERDRKDAALQEKMEALTQRDRAFTSAEAERRRAEGNLDLALAAMDAVYLDAIGRDKLLGKPAAQPEGAERHESEERAPLTELERELLKRGLDFYDQFAQQNAAAPLVFVQTAQAYYRVGLLQGALGDTDAAAEAYRGAVERFERLTEEEPDNAEHFRRLAEAYTGLGNVVRDWPEAKEMFDKAQVAYSKAIELKPQEALLYLLRADVRKTLSDQRAVEDYEKALQLDPDNIQGHLKCSAYYRDEHWHSPHRDPEKARKHAERAVALAPDDPDCHMQLARALTNRMAGHFLETPAGQPSILTIPNAASVLEEYARAIELAPERPDIIRARAAFYTLIGEYERALIDLDRALSLEPDDISSLCVRAEVYAGLEQFDNACADLAALTNARPNDAKAYNLLGEIHMRRGNWQAAADALTKAIDIRPLVSYTYKRRAVAYLNLGHHVRALDDLEKALEISPVDTSAIRWIPASDLERAPEGFRQRLVALADSALERSPEPGRAYTDRAWLHTNLKQYDEADADYAEAAKFDEGWINWGTSYRVRGMWQEAREKYTKAVEASPDWWAAWRSRGIATFKLGDFAAAAADFSKALELYPPCRSVLSYRCAAYLRLGQLDKARDDLTALREIKAGNCDDYFQQALLCLALREEDQYRDSCLTMLEVLGGTDDPMGANFVAWTCALAPDAVDDYEPVLACATKTVEAQPDSHQFINTLGAILYRAGRSGESIERLTELDRRREAAGPDQSSPAYTWYFLAMAHQKAGNAKQAREYLNKANQSMDEEFTDAKAPPPWERRATLELLRKEAEALLGTDVLESADRSAVPEGKSDKQMEVEKNEQHE